MLTPYENRSFFLTLADGTEVSLRGMIEERKVDQMAERLYAALRSGVS
jgi:hypothetical protein